MEFLIGIIIIIGWLLPFLIILFSEKTHGGEKLAWLLAMLFISWFAWIFYMLLAPLKHDPYGEREEGNKGLIVGKENEDVGYDEKESASNNGEALVLALTVVAVLVVVWTSTY